MTVAYLPCLPFSLLSFLTFSLQPRFHVRRLVLPLMVLCVVPTAYAITPTTTTLTIASPTVAFKSPILLTATVKANGQPVTSGLVLFCDAAAPFCENNSALALAQLTATGASAVVKIGSGPLGNHSYKAVYRPNTLYTGSTSNTVTYTVVGSYNSTTTLTSSGGVGNYSLSATVAGVGAALSGPTGNVSFLDASAGNHLLGTQPLGPATLSHGFVAAAGSPFAIGGGNTSVRSVAIASAYLSSDNNLDVVTGDAAATISVLKGNGDGTFQPKVNYPGCAIGRALKILLADFNRDGNTDVVLGCSDGTNGGIAILLGNGDGSFQTPTQYASGDVAGLALGDFNTDGLLDLVITNRTQHNVTLFLGKGDGTFQAPLSPFNTTANAHDVVVADFNGDGKDDLVFAVDTANSGSTLSDLYLALGNGDATFSLPTLKAPQVGEFLTTGDTNADNFPDVISSTITLPLHVGNNMWVLIGKGDGTFQPTVTLISDIPSDPHLADVNGDGKPDIIAGGSTGALVYHGNGDGTFQPYTQPSIANFALTYAVNAGDYNNDGNADLIGTDALSPQAAVALSEVRQTATTAALTGLALLPLGSGTHNVDASYEGDTLYATSLSSTTPLLAAPTPTTLTLSVAPTSATLQGQALTLTATLNPYAVGPPNTTTNGQTIKFFNGSSQIGTGTLSNGIATLVTSALPVGTDALKAVFPGDSNYLTSTSATVNVTVTSILLSSSLNPSTFGKSVTFTATVAAVATGTVTFYDGATALGTATISGSTATLTTSTLTVGSHDITGVYSGDSSHNAATSPILTQVVNKATPTVTVTTPGPSTYGNPVDITVTLPPGTTGSVVVTSGTTTLGTGNVTAAGTITITTSGLPTGTDPITATYNGDGSYNPSTGSTTQTVNKANPVLPAPVVSPTNPIASTPVTITQTVPAGVSGPVTFYDGSTVLGTAPIVSGTATLTIPSLPVGPHPISTTTPGDTNNNPATSPTTNVTVSKSTPTVTVATSGTTTYGSAVTITATLPTGVTGTVTITSGGVTLGTGTVVNGIVTITTSTLPTGTDPITATYNGDVNNNPNAGTTTQVVSKTNPTVTVTTSGPSTYGDPVTITATVPTGVTGTVTITSGTAILGSGSVTAAGTVTITTSTLPPGIDPITATYSGDSNTNPATGNTTQSVAKSNPTVTVTTSGPSTYGSPVTITATVPPGVTGTVTLTSGGTTLGTGTVVAGPVNGTVTITTSSLPAGSNPITGTYHGDPNNNPGNGNITQTVTKTTPPVTVTTSGPGTYGTTTTITTTVPPGTTGTVTITSGGVTIGTGTVSTTGTVTITTSNLPAGIDPVTITFSGDSNNNPTSTSATITIAKQTPTVVLASSNNPSTVTQPVTFTATVPAGVTGTVAFYNGTLLLGTGTVVIGNAGGIATFTTSTLPAGSTTITASYGGDSNNTTALSAPLAQTINKATPTLPATGVSSNNPTIGSPVTITENVPPGVSGPISFSNGTTLLGTATVINGVATLTVSTLPLGPNPITATTPGDASNNPATSPATLVIVIKSTPVLAPPTASNNNPATGTPITISQIVPTGTTGPVSFYNGGTLLGTATPVNGVATLTVPTLPVGQNPITTNIPGDPNNNSATSPVLIITTSKAVATITLTTSLNPSSFNQAVTFTASVPAGATGTILFSDGATLLGTAPINAAGVASLATSSLAIGAHLITAAFAGDTNFSAVTSLVLTQNVTRSLTTTVLTQSTAAQILGTSVTFTATVASAFTSPTGTVSFFDGNTLLGTAPVSTTGATAFSLSTLATGAHIITAAYSGDNVSAASASIPLTNTVHDFTNTAMGATTISGFPGATAAYNFDLSPLGTSAFLENVTITVTGLPVGTTYSFTPAMMHAGTGRNGSILNLKTSESLNASNHAPSNPLQNRGTIALGLLGLVGLGAARKRRHQLPRLVVLLLLCLGSLLPLVAVTGCAGGYFALTPTTYNVQITATEGAVQHTANVTLVIQ